MELTDTHAHLHFDQYREDLAQVIDRARRAGLRRILTLGTERASSQEAIRIARQFDLVYAAIGIHPTDIFKGQPEDSEILEEMARREAKVVAIGEIGLDLYWKEVPLEAQLPVLEKMLAIARKLDLPVVIHNRDAQKEMRIFFEEKEIEQLRGVMHSFAGSVDDARFYLERGMYISFTGVITFKNFKQIEVVESVPPERLLLETDSPFLTPVPYRGKRNEPAYVRYIAEKLAEIHHRSVEEICALTARNARELFRW